MSQKVLISPSQCRAARELLNWNQEALSKKSKISQATISNFERNQSSRELKLGTIIDILEAFQNEGITFHTDDNRYGVFLDISNDNDPKNKKKSRNFLGI
jgi:transcriptional regulator with XRE-family HTH domain